MINSGDDTLIKKFPNTMKSNMGIILGALFIVFAGVGTGYVLAGPSKSSNSGTSSEMAAPGVTEKKDEMGIQDEETFPDSAEGLLVEGGIEGEGTHHLDRGLGPTKHVYLTSTVIDLQSFAGKKVKVWGQTISAQKAGWLMDVGKIKVGE